MHLVVLQHIGYNVGQVVDCDNFLFVAKLYYALSYFLYAFLIEVDAYRFEILSNVGFTGIFAQSIFANSTEALGKQVVVVEVAFVVAIGMNTGALREHVFADDGFVWRNNHAGERFHDVANLVDFLLVDAR